MIFVQNKILSFFQNKLGEKYDGIQYKVLAFQDRIGLTQYESDFEKHHIDKKNTCFDIIITSYLLQTKMDTTCLITFCPPSLHHCKVTMTNRTGCLPYILLS